jgi:DNA-directed RNA polymerase subunit RPC12/RpoP
VKPEDVIYECISCGHRAPQSKWEEIEGQFRCPNCGHSKIAKKIRPPVVRRVKAV